MVSSHEETPFGTNLEYIRRNLSLTPEERFLKYAARHGSMRMLMDELTRWRASKSSSGSTLPTPATSS